MHIFNLFPELKKTWRRICSSRNCQIYVRNCARVSTLPFFTAFFYFFSLSNAPPFNPTNCLRLQETSYVNYTLYNRVSFSFMSNNDSFSFNRIVVLLNSFVKDILLHE